MLKGSAASASGAGIVACYLSLVASRALVSYQPDFGAWDGATAGRLGAGVGFPLGMPALGTSPPVCDRLDGDCCASQRAVCFSETAKVRPSLGQRLMSDMSGLPSPIASGSTQRPATASGFSLMSAICIW